MKKRISGMITFAGDEFFRPIYKEEGISIPRTERLSSSA